MREYLSNGVWSKNPCGKIKGMQYALGNLMPKVEGIAAAWKFIEEKSIEQPAKSNRIIEQLASSRLKPETLRLFTAWGPRFKKNEARIASGDAELKTLDEIRDVFLRFGEEGFSVSFLLVPADAHAIEINGLPKSFVMDYFRYVEDAALKVLSGTADIEIRPWSSIRTEYGESYCRLKEKISDDLQSWVKKEEYEKAVKAASFFSRQNAEQSARNYCIERLIEGKIIADAFDPIKLSLVRKEKDTLNQQLPRLYIIKNRAPWMQE